MNNIFSKRIKEIRLKENMTMEEFSHIFELTRSSINMWENGSSVPRVDTLLKISKWFNVSIDYLLGNEGVKMARFEMVEKFAIKEAFETPENCKCCLCQTSIKDVEAFEIELKSFNSFICNFCVTSLNFYSNKESEEVKKNKEHIAALERDIERLTKEKNIAITNFNEIEKKITLIKYVLGGKNDN